MCQNTVQEAKVPEKVPRDIKQSPLTQMPESIQSQERLTSIPHKVSEITPHNIEFSVLGIPIVHLNCSGDTPQVAETIKGKIMPLAAAPTLLQSFAGRIKLFTNGFKQCHMSAQTSCLYRFAEVIKFIVYIKKLVCRNCVYAVYSQLTLCGIFGGSFNLTVW